MLKKPNLFILFNLLFFSLSLNLLLPVNSSGTSYQATLNGTSYLNGLEQTITDANSVSINWANGGTAVLALNRATTAITLTNPANGQVYRLKIAQVAGSQTVGWVTTIKWRGNTTPTLTTTAGQSDWITFIYSGSAYYADISKNF